MNKPSKTVRPSLPFGGRRLVQPERESKQKGAVGIHSGKWSLRYRELDHFTGKWSTRREVLEPCRDRKTALQLALPIMTEVNEYNNHGPQQPGEKLTFKRFVESYWKPYAVKKGFKASTIDHHNSLLEIHLFPFFGQALMERVRPSDISKFMLLKTSAEPGYSNSTLHGFYQFLRMLFDLAEQYDVIGKSPVRPKLHKPEAVKVEKPTLSVVQIRDVLANLEDDQERLFMLLLAVTGMRIGEGQALRWMDFNAHACQLSINHTLYKGELEAPKTKGSKARLMLTQRMVELLLSHRRSLTFREADHYVFSRADGSPLEASSLRLHLYEAMDKVGIKRVKGKYGPHIFRHSAGTLLYEKSRDLKLVQGALRHSDISTTSDIYVHLGDQVLGEGSEILTTEIIGPVSQHVQSLPARETAPAPGAGHITEEPPAPGAGESTPEPAAFNADQSATKPAAFNAGVPENQQ